MASRPDGDDLDTSFLRLVIHGPGKLAKLAAAFEWHNRPNTKA